MKQGKKSSKKQRAQNESLNPDFRNKLGDSHTGGQGSRSGLHEYDMNWSKNDYQKRYWEKKDEHAWGQKYAEASLPGPSGTVQFHQDSYHAHEEKTRLKALAEQQGNTAAAFLRAVSSSSSKEKEITTNGSGCNLFSVSEDPQQNNDQDPPQEVPDSPAPKNSLSEEADGVEKKPANEDKIESKDSGTVNKTNLNPPPSGPVVGTSSSLDDGKHEGNQGKTLVEQYPGSFELMDRNTEMKRTKYQEECAAKWTEHQQEQARMNGSLENMYPGFAEFKEQLSRAPSTPSLSLSASAAGLHNNGGGAERWGFDQENSSSFTFNGHDNNHQDYWQSWGQEGAENGDTTTNDEKSGSKWYNGKWTNRIEGGAWTDDVEYHKLDDLAWMERMKMDGDKRDSERAVWDGARSSGWSDLGWSGGKNTSSSAGGGRGEGEGAAAGGAREWGQRTSYGTCGSSSNYYYGERKKWYKRGDGQWDYYINNGYDNWGHFGDTNKWDTWGRRWDVNWNAKESPEETRDEWKAGAQPLDTSGAPLGTTTIGAYSNVLHHDELTDSRASVSIENPRQELVEMTDDGGVQHKNNEDDGRGFRGSQLHLVVSNSESDGSDHRPKVIPETPSPCHEQEEGDEKGPLMQLLSSNFDLTPGDPPVPTTSSHSGNSPVTAAPNFHSGNSFVTAASAPDPLKSATWDESTLFHAGSTLAIHDASWECSLAVLSRIQDDPPLPPPVVDEFPTVEDDASEHMYHQERENEHIAAAGPYEHMGWMDMAREEARCSNLNRDDIDFIDGDVFNELWEGDEVTSEDERADAEDLHFMGLTEYHKSLPSHPPPRGLGNNYASCPPQFPPLRMRDNSSPPLLPPRVNGGVHHNISPVRGIRWDDTPWSPTAFMRSASQWRRGDPEVTLPRPLYVRSGPPAGAEPHNRNHPQANMNLTNMSGGGGGNRASWDSPCHHNHTSQARRIFTPSQSTTSPQPRNFLSNFQSTAAHDEADEPMFNSFGEFMGYLSSHSSRDGSRMSEGRQVHHHHQLSHPSMASSGDEVTFHPNLRGVPSQQKQKSADFYTPIPSRCGHSGTVNSSGDEVLSFPGMMRSSSMMRAPDSRGQAQEYYIGNDDADDVDDDDLVDEFTSPSDDVARQMGADRIYSRSMGAYNNMHRVKEWGGGADRPSSRLTKSAGNGYPR